MVPHVGQGHLVCGNHARACGRVGGAEAAGDDRPGAGGFEVGHAAAGYVDDPAVERHTRGDVSEGRSDGCAPGAQAHAVAGDVRRAARATPQASCPRARTSIEAVRQGIDDLVRLNLTEPASADLAVIRIADYVRQVDGRLVSLVEVDQIPARRARPARLQRVSEPPAAGVVVSAAA